MLARLAQLGRPAPRKPLGIVLVPTRELAMQVGDALEPYTHALGLHQRLVAGGLSMSKQIQSLERGVHLVVATPGRLADLMRRGHAILDEVTISVLDEADHMAEMGFGEEIAEILAMTPPTGQRLLFSATLDGVVDELVSRFMKDPVLHDVTAGTDAPTQRHVVLAIPPHEKYQLATRIAAREGRTICFVRTKLGADRVAEEMRSAGVLAVALHGDRSQYERNQAMTEFRAGRLPVLVATDVAARGIHVDAVDVVVQIDPPSDFRDYTHRAGRTGRAGADGLAVTLALPHQRKQMDRILEGAGITAERAHYKNIDAAALAQIDALTGGRQPSGQPVEEPIAPPRADRRGRRGETHVRVARHTPAGEAALAARERSLEERERALAERERRLAEREHAAASSAASDGDRPAPHSALRDGDTRKPNAWESRDRTAGAGRNWTDRRPSRDDERKSGRGSDREDSGRDDRRPLRGEGWKSRRDDERTFARDSERRPARRDDRGANRGEDRGYRGEDRDNRGARGGGRAERDGRSRPASGKGHPAERDAERSGDEQSTPRKPRHRKGDGSKGAGTPRKGGASSSRKANPSRNVSGKKKPPGKRPKRP